MIVSVTVRFPACSLLWTAEVVHLEALTAPINLDAKTPDVLGLNIIAVQDGRGLAVHPQVFAPLIVGQTTRELVRASALAEIASAARRLLEGPAGDVQATPDLVENPREAIVLWGSMNTPQPPA